MTDFEAAEEIVSLLEEAKMLAAKHRFSEVCTRIAHAQKANFELAGRSAVPTDGRK
jgi:hypothetical protein